MLRSPASASSGTNSYTKYCSVIVRASALANLVLLAVAIASESLVRYVLHGTNAAWTVTLRDFAVHPLETT
jgi:hypothetical protein